MKVKPLQYLLFFLTIVSIGSAEEVLHQSTQGFGIPADASSVVYFRDIYTGVVLRNIIVQINVHNLDNDDNTEREYLINSTGSLYLDFRYGKLNITVYADNLFTPGKDYYGQYFLDSNNYSNIDLFLFSTGTVRGIVLDKLDNLVSDARLKFDCITSNGDVAPTRTDEFGSFSYDFAPAGECKISAIYKDAVGSANIVVSNGNITETIIKLDKTIVSDSFFMKNNFWQLNFFIFFAILTIVVIYLKFIRKTKKRHTEENKLSKRTKDIMNTLNEREKCVINLLLENMHELSQNIVKHKTRIPKTSLSRIFESLKKKNIIAIDKEGNLVKVKLTLWFLGKE